MRGMYPFTSSILRKLVVVFSEIVKKINGLTTTTLAICKNVFDVVGLHNFFIISNLFDSNKP